MVEFAVSIMVLCLLLSASSDFGRLFYYSDIVWNAARAGVQYGMMNSANASDITGMQNAALAEPGSTLTGLTATATQYCQCAGVSGTVTCNSTCSGGVSPQMYIQVTTSYPFTTTVNWLWVPSSVTLNGKTVMRVQ